ncbi:MAG: hypothetical protein AAB421_04565 [Patescibacteria group bacterium]
MLGLSINAFRQDPSAFNAAGVILDAGALAFPGVPAVGGMALRAGKAADATYSLYRGADDVGTTRYVGITKRDTEVRWNEHRGKTGSGKDELDYEVVGPKGALTKTEARLGEQSLIEKFGMQKNGGQLLNLRNSISPTSQLSTVAQSFGHGVSGSLQSKLSSLSSALTKLSAALKSLKK